MKIMLLLVSISLLLSSCSPKSTPSIPQTFELTPTTIVESGLPSKHLIQTTFIPQAPEKNWDQPWQDACEEASLLTLKYYYQGSNPDMTTMIADYQQIFSYSDQNSWTHDINLQQMSQIASDLFKLNPKLIANPQADDIKKYLSQNIPIIITANGKTLYKENKHFKSGGPWYHSLVILGYDDSVGQFIVHDVGTQFGAYFKYSYSLLMESIHDLPTSGIKEDINSGDKKVLILIK